ncbi:16S rRNA (adenine(1518)-N(6)/adenine(1519)-N(6))-dimethyltransferase RsmA [Persephonella atlantica]|uniref:Ribosomal RNA small subunit methyltransferase A n=1 Tax=Persephonella atlantica TaxID=2699429 RepID=A0ABS1GIE0_9AQUI|nr:16S rRNA (adenine(1518)-N(6)/adenine(1519)-N(6))-dimethyltransferase RsmA [Persephonella atlantica]MBK3332692.1 16S rRNA (adenine(1518)-N(6)/adenine(1519)-N(6))-dimethyltransferase RsmA [Persephonella atlantica]
MKSRKFKTKKKFGQHILISEGVIKNIADQIHITPEDIIVEIGVGTGQLTEELLKRNPKILYGIEIDPETYPIIEEKFASYQNFILIKKDFFEVNLRQLSEGEKIKIVGNLPYNVASLILVNMPFYLKIINLCVFMLQKEVAEKLTAKPETKSYTFLTVFLNTYFEIHYLMSVPARFFRPPPKVTSAVVKMIPKKDVPQFDVKGYKNFVSKLFHERRKMLRSKIDEKLLEKAGIEPEKRVEQLQISDFINLYTEYLKGKHKSKN